MKNYVKRHGTVGTHDAERIVEVVLVIPNKAALRIAAMTRNTALYRDFRDIQSDILIYFHIGQLISVAATEFNDAANSALADHPIYQVCLI